MFHFVGIGILILQFLTRSTWRISWQL